MAVVQGACTGQEVDVFLAIFVVQIAAFGLIEYHRKATCIAHYFRFVAFKNVCIHGFCTHDSWSSLELGFAGALRAAFTLRRD